MPNILASVDLSDAAAAVVREAEAFAVALGGKLTLLYVAEPNPEEFVGYEAGPPSVIVDRASQLKERRAALDSLVADLRGRGVDVESLVLEGVVAETILAEADELDARLIIVGSHGHGMLYHALVGSVSAAVLKHTHRPVLVVPDPRSGRNTSK